MAARYDSNPFDEEDVNPFAVQVLPLVPLLLRPLGFRDLGGRSHTHYCRSQIGSGRVFASWTRILVLSFRSIFAVSRDWQGAD